jgi:hypothetical protein
MEFVKVDVDIPESVIALYNEIRKIAPNTCIAGGFLCDSYLKKPFNDVDIFIGSANYPEEKKEAILKLMDEKNAVIMDKEDREFGNTYEVLMTFEVRNFELDGYHFQLIFTPFGSKIVKHFDLRIREFVYVRGKVYASKAALLDIEQKRIVIGSFHSPLRTYYRAHRFASQYGFSVDPVSLDLFSNVFNSFIVTSEHIKNYAQRLPDHFGKNSILDLLQYENKVLDRIRIPTPYEKGVNKAKDWFLEHISTHTVERDVLERAYVLLDGYENVSTFSFDLHPGERMLEFVSEEIVRAIKRVRLELIFNATTIQTDELMLLQKDLLVPAKRLASVSKIHDEYIPVLARSGVESGLLNSLKQHIYFYESLCEEVTVKVSNLPNFIKMQNSLRVFIERQPFSVLIESKEGGYLAGFVYDKDKQQFLKSDSWYSHDLVDEHCFRQLAIDSIQKIS